MMTGLLLPRSAGCGPRWLQMIIIFENAWEIERKVKRFRVLDNLKSMGEALAEPDQHCEQHMIMEFLLHAFWKAEEKAYAKDAIATGIQGRKYRI